MKYAVIKTGGKQYRVAEDDVLAVEKLSEEKGKPVTFDQVLLVVDRKKVSLGQPLIDQGKVEGEVLEHFRGPKVRVAKFKAKSRYRRVQGHRQELTRIRIKKIADVQGGSQSDQKEKKETKS